MGSRRRHTLLRGATSTRPSLLPERQRKVELGSFVQPGLGPDASAVSCDDPLHGRQADPAALEFIGSMQALERPEQLRRMAHIEAHTVVANVIDILAWSRLVPHFNRRGRLV